MRNSIYSAAWLLLFGAAVIGCNKTAETTAAPEIADPVEATSVSFANTKCPIMGGKPKAELTAKYGTETIGFCCDGCPQKWDALSDDQKAEKLTALDVHVDLDGHDHADHSHE